MNLLSSNGKNHSLKICRTSLCSLCQQEVMLVWLLRRVQHRVDSHLVVSGCDAVLSQPLCSLTATPLAYQGGRFVGAPQFVQVQAHNSIQVTSCFIGQDCFCIFPLAYDNKSIKSSVN